MKKVSIIYWSNGGNVEILAESISMGARALGAEVNIKHVTDAEIEDVVNSDAIAFGSPSIDNNKIEQQDMEPFISQLEGIENKSKKLVLFGSYGWDNGDFMENWAKRMESYNFNIIGEVAVQETPTKSQISKARKLGELLAQ